MTIEAVLKHHGHNCARSILPSGRLRFDIKAPAAASVSMPLKSHLFHGGIPRKDVEGKGERWWKEPNSLDLEVSMMSKYFPGFRLLGGTDDGPPAWFGSIETMQAKYDLMVLHRRDHSLPRVIPMNPKPRGRTVNDRYQKSPHLYLNGDLCVASADDWDLTRDTAADVVGWSAHWHAVYQDWASGRRWATKGYRSREAA